MASLFLLATMISSMANAGVDAWTTTGPRSLWTFIQADGRAGGVMFVADFDRWARSADGGATWAQLETPNGAVLRVRAICADPQVPGRFYGALINDTDQVFHRSDDGGATWVLQPGTIPGSPFPLNAVASSMDCEGSRLYVAGGGSNQGLYRSNDGAATPFQRIEIPSGPGTIVFARAGQRLVVARWGDRLVHTSADDGATWAPIAFELPDGFRFRSIAWAGGSRYVAVVQSPSADGVLHSVWISDDHGVSFIERPGAAFVGTGPRVTSDPLQRSRLMIYGSVLRVSVDAGETWSVVSGVPEGETVRAATWAAPRTAGDSALWITTPNRGLMMSTDAGGSFVAQNRGLPGSKATDVDSSLYGGERIELLTDAGGLQRRGTSSNRWERIEYPDCAVAAREVLGLLIAPVGWRSLDAGATWTQQAGVDKGPGCTETTFGRRYGEPATLIAWNRPYSSGGFPSFSVPSNVWLGVDDGASWSQITDPNDSDGFASIFGAAVAPSNPQVVYASSLDSFYVGESYVGQAAYVHRSTDRGATWTRHRVPGDPFVGPLYVDLVDANRILLSVYNSNAPRESFDGGATWSTLPAIPSATTVLTITVDEGSSPRRTYAGTDDGVFVRVGDATGWQRVGELQGMRVNKILIDGPPDRRTLEIASDRGVFEMTLDTSTATLPVYRFYNTQTRTHFYTASEAERQHVLATWPHFIPEGIAFHAIKADRTLVGNPVWRFFNTQTGTHFYTAFPAERAHVLATWPQFVEEGVVYRAVVATEPGTVKLFRFFNTETGAHFTTTEDDERDYVNSRLPMFVDEGPTYSVYPAAPAQ